ncbi:MAG: hypothetical protein FXF47_03500 [Candidatus Mcinerneyibacterium aminivorans]|uniref:Phasin family protein n=1 Tax=Candidatus Mcinerneyibacterium aminivorans TaxID=2703815 RepID=A0A5D0MD36_9BACT|nr:MAG: hypothetical protein FXF47_03500 [Candidatus Mcinerneyibacterium aminivorans]
MKDFLKKTILTGIGIASLTGEKIKEIGKKIAEESKMSEEEGEKFVDEILKQSEKTKKNIEKKVDEYVKKSLDKLDIPNQDKVEKLEKRINKLEKKLKEITTKDE